MSEHSLTVRLNTKSAMIVMGEPIDAFSEARLMGEAADELTRLQAENERLRKALEYYAFGAPTCETENGIAVTQGCNHQNCEFPKCANKTFPTRDNGRTARAALSPAP